MPGTDQKAVIDIRCVAHRNVVCRSCVEACSEQAIRCIPRIMAAALPQVEPDRCTGCGDCASVCPAAAITFS